MDYKSLLAFVKEQISASQVRAVSAANKEMLFLYWKLGQAIISYQTIQGWGSKVIQLLSKDLKREFPKQKGYSVRNLKYMRRFALDYSSQMLEQYQQVSEKLCTLGQIQDGIKEVISQFVQQAAAQIESTDLQSNRIVQQDAAQFTEALFFDSVVSKVTWSHHLILLDKEPHFGKRLW